MKLHKIFSNALLKNPIKSTLYIDKTTPVNRKLTKNTLNRVVYSNFGVGSEFVTIKGMFRAI